MMPVNLSPAVLAIAFLMVFLVNLKRTCEWGKIRKNQSSIEGFGIALRLNKKIDGILRSGWVLKFRFLW